MVCEACEFVDTFLKLSPDITIVLNIDADHLDYFKTLDNIIVSFRKFCVKTSKTIIINGEDANCMKAIEGITGKKIITFGFDSSNDYYPIINKTSGMQTDFSLMYRDEKICNLTTHVPGLHNVLNAIAAAVAALNVGASIDGISLGLQTFRGAGRRFEKIAEINGVTIVDDYAHHPTEIRATLEAAKKLDFKRVWAVHQPFTYSRTKMLLDDFAKALQIADKTVLTEIMGSREKNTLNIYSKDLAEKIPEAVWFSTFEEVAHHVAKNSESGDLIITLGCGDVYKVAKMIAKLLKEKSGG